MGAVVDLVGLSDYTYQRTRARLEGLGDEEYMWEPAPGCWSVRAGADEVPTADWAPLPDRPPFTTIAWRLWHLIEVYGAARNERLLRGTDDGDHDRRCAPRATTAEAMAGLEGAYGWWRALLSSLGVADLSEPLGPIAGQYAESDKAGFVVHQLDEAIHHGAELALLRDLYAHTVAGPPLDPSVEALLCGQRLENVNRTKAEQPDLLRWAAANGYWRVVPALLDLGFDVNAARGGATALHHSAGAGRIDLVRLLIERGADTFCRDDRFHATPLGWAEFFGQTPVVEYLTVTEQSASDGISR